MKLKKHSKILIGIVVAVLLLTGITAGYLQSYYHTDTQAVSAYQLQQSLIQTFRQRHFLMEALCVYQRILKLDSSFIREEK